MSHANFGTFLDSWSTELAAQANRVRQLIGDAHWLSDGNHKETILRTFLRRYLPPSLSVGSGFALNPSRDRGVTRQIDVLVCALDDQTPFLVEGDFHVVPASSVAAHLEVKSTLSASTLKDAVQSALENEAVIDQRADPAWRGIIYFSAEEGDEVRLQEWTKAALASAGAALLDRQISPLCVIGTGKFIAFVDTITSSSARLRILLTEDKSLAFGMLDLLATVRARVGGRRTESIDDLAQATSSVNPIIHRLTY